MNVSSGRADVKYPLNVIPPQLRPPTPRPRSHSIENTIEGSDEDGDATPVHDRRHVH